MKISIASGKGGTGKTTLATNLSVLLSTDNKVVLVDLDVEEPNSGLFVKGELIHKEEKFKMIPDWVKDKCTLCGQCQRLCKFNAVIKMINNIMVFPQLCHSCYACSELCPENALPMKPIKIGDLRHEKTDQLDFIQGTLLIGEEQAVPMIAQTKDYVDDHFNETYIKIYDSPPGTSCPVIEATKGVDFVILVTEPTPFGLHDLKLAIDTMEELRIEYGVVINRSGIGNNDVEKFCSEKKVPILAKIPNDRAIAELYSYGNLLQIPSVIQPLKKLRIHLKTGREMNNGN